MLGVVYLTFDENICGTGLEYTTIITYLFFKVYSIQFENTIDRFELRLTGFEVFRMHRCGNMVT